MSECPCFKCDHGSGSANNSGVVMSCREDCHDLKVWQKTHPRICTVLGVKINQRFRIDYPKGMTNWLHINEDGLVERDGGSNNFKIGNSIAYAINHPESIHRQPLFTDEEKADATAILRLHPSATHIERLSCGNILGISENISGWVCDLRPDLFPSIKPGTAVRITEIIEED